MMVTVVAILLLPLVLLLFFLLYKALLCRSKKDPSKFTIGLFHPYCNAGGGGERVLFLALSTLLRDSSSKTRILLYTGDARHVTKGVLAEKARKRFGVNVNLEEDERVSIVYLEKRGLVEAHLYPIFTLLGQSIGSMILGLEALDKSPATPDVFIDTMGYAFVMPIFKVLANCKVGCYVHYPTISTDMLKSVNNRLNSYNNRRVFANSSFLTSLKLAYYKLFASLYGLMGRCSDLSMVNSSWTEEHICRLWGSSRVHKLYPPCDVGLFSGIARSDSSEEEIRIVSLGQFRPEKDHPLQLRIMAAIRDELMERDNEHLWKRMKLVLIGGCRDASDESRVSDLRDLSRHMSIESNVEFHINADLSTLKFELSRALIGLHTMWNEHFGIAVVELMAAGLLVVANRSGGPLMDIVEEGSNGFLADNELNYAQTILNILELCQDEKETIVKRAKVSLERFSDQTFSREWTRLTKPLLELQ